MKLLFHDMAEFLEELQADRELVERGVVRLVVNRLWHGNPVQEELIVVGTCVMGGVLVELRHPVGGGFLFEREADRELEAARTRARSLLEDLQYLVANMGLKVRAGCLTDARARGA